MSRPSDVIYVRPKTFRISKHARRACEKMNKQMAPGIRANRQLMCSA